MPGIFQTTQKSKYFDNKLDNYNLIVHKFIGLFDVIASKIINYITFSFYFVEGTLVKTRFFVTRQLYSHFQSRVK